MRVNGITKVAVLGAAAVLAACGGDDGDDAGAAEDPGASEAVVDGEAFEGELEDGSTLRVTLDVAADHDAVAPFEELRAAAGGPEVTWLVGEIDVPEGVDGTGRFVTFVAAGADPLDDDPLDDGDGIVAADFACSLIDDWAGTSTDTAVADLHLEVYEGPCGGQTLQVLAPGGGTTTYVLAIEGGLPDFERLLAGLGNELDAV